MPLIGWHRANSTAHLSFQPGSIDCTNTQPASCTDFSITVLASITLIRLGLFSLENTRLGSSPSVLKSRLASPSPLPNNSPIPKATCIVDLFMKGFSIVAVPFTKCTHWWSSGRFLCLFRSGIIILPSLARSIISSIQASPKVSVKNKQNTQLLPAEWFLPQRTIISSNLPHVSLLAPEALLVVVLSPNSSQNIERGLWPASFCSLTAYDQNFILLPFVILSKPVTIPSWSLLHFIWNCSPRELLIVCKPLFL